MSIIRIQFKMSLSKVKAELEELSRRLINLRNNQIHLESDQISRQISEERFSPDYWLESLQQARKDNG
jgi:hypothetical protein